MVYPRLARSLASYCGDPALGADLAQEALARAWERWDRVSTMDAPAMWVYRTGLNLARSQARRRASDGRSPRVWQLPESAVDHDAERWADVIAVREAIAMLPDRQRAAVVLRYQADLSIDDTAGVMGCATGTVKALTHQALEQLRRRLDVPDPAPGYGHDRPASSSSSATPATGQSASSTRPQLRPGPDSGDIGAARRSPQSSSTLALVVGVAAVAWPDQPDRSVVSTTGRAPEVTWTPVSLPPGTGGLGHVSPVGPKGSSRSATSVTQDDPTDLSSVATIWRSTDGGATWAVVYTDANVVTDELGRIKRPAASFDSAYYLNGMFVVTGTVNLQGSDTSIAGIWTSPDGTTWTKADDTSSELRSLRAESTERRQRIAASHDVTTWHGRSSPSATSTSTPRRRSNAAASGSGCGRPATASDVEADTSPTSATASTPTSPH